MTPDGAKRHQFAWMPFLLGKQSYPVVNLARMMQNVFGTMFLTAMPSMKLDAKKDRVPLTNMQLYPMNDVMVTTELPLRIGRNASDDEGEQVIEPDMKPTKESEGTSPD